MRSTSPWLRATDAKDRPMSPTPQIVNWRKSGAISEPTQAREAGGCEQSECSTAAPLVRHYARRLSPRLIGCNGPEHLFKRFDQPPIFRFQTDTDSHMRRQAITAHRPYDYAVFEQVIKNTS